MMEHLRESMRRYGLVENLVVRRLGPDAYEVLSGNQRLRLLRELGASPVPCSWSTWTTPGHACWPRPSTMSGARMTWASRRSWSGRCSRPSPRPRSWPSSPRARGSLRSLASMGQETMAAHLQSWQRARECRLRNLLFKLTPAQLEVVEEALHLMLPAAREDPARSPNVRGTAIYLVCESFLEREKAQ